MERLKELITQLKEQFDQKAEPAQLLEITRLLEAEIRLMASQPPAPARVMPTKIAVMMPSPTKIVEKEAVAVPNGAAMAQPNGPVAAIATSAVSAPAVAAAIAASPVSAPAAVAQAPGTAAAVAQTAVTQTAVANGTVTLKANPERGQWPFDPLAEKPTDRFTLSQKAREVNDVIGATSASSLNDKLRSEVVDLKSTLNDSPVRDLKKAIGLNDRYLFINQLFRGDEVMYERSLKTINGFRILPEAEYWMERELKVKLGWDENRETTRHFYQLVKRRFS